MATVIKNIHSICLWIGSVRCHVTRNQTFLLNNAWKGFSLNNVCSTSNHGVNAFSQMSKTYMNPSCLARIYAYNARIYAYNARIYAYNGKVICRDFTPHCNGWGAQNFREWIFPLSIDPAENEPRQLQNVQIVSAILCQAKFF